MAARLAADRSRAGQKRPDFDRLIPRSSGRGLADHCEVRQGGRDGRDVSWVADSDDMAEAKTMGDGMFSTLQFQGKALALRAERQAVLAGNIANVDTPAFKARDFDFSAALTRATGVQAPTGGSTGAATATKAAAAAATTASLAATRSSAPVQPGHLPLKSDQSRVWSTSDARMLYRQPEQAAIDGNTVELDRERAAFADNAVRYEATLRMINGNVRTMLGAIKGE